MLRAWIPNEKFNLSNLLVFNQNPQAVSYLLEIFHNREVTSSHFELDWYGLSSYCKDVPILELNLEHINWSALAAFS